VLSVRNSLVCGIDAVEVAYTFEIYLWVFTRECKGDEPARHAASLRIVAVLAKAGGINARQLSGTLGLKDLALYRNKVVDSRLKRNGYFTSKKVT
jgi:hypothetical protein